jgi:hypothetical protein
VLGGEPVVLTSPTGGRTLPTPLTRIGRIGTLPFTGFALTLLLASALLLLGGGTAVRRAAA